MKTHLPSPEAIKADLQMKLALFSAADAMKIISTQAAVLDDPSPITLPVESLMDDLEGALEVWRKQRGVSPSLSV